MHRVAGLERPATRPDIGQPRQRIGVLDPREHGLGVADRAVRVDQVDPERALQARQLVAEGDDGIAVRADGQAPRIDAVDLVGVEALLLDELRKRAEIRHGDLPALRRRSAPSSLLSSGHAWPIGRESIGRRPSPTLRRVLQLLLVLLCSGKIP